MARRNTQTIANRAASMTSEEWSIQGLSTIPDRELRQLYTQQRDIERKRMATLEKSFPDAGVLKRFDLAPKLSEIKSKDQLVKELSDMHRFLSMKTSTASGQRAIERRFRKNMEDIAGHKLTKQEADQMGRLMDKISAAVKDKAFKYTAVMDMLQAAKEKGIKNPDKFFKDMDFWSKNIDKLNQINTITTPTGRVSQSAASYRRAINFYNKLEKFAGD